MPRQQDCYRFYKKIVFQSSISRAVGVTGKSSFGGPFSVGIKCSHFLRHLRQY